MAPGHRLGVTVGDHLEIGVLGIVTERQVGPTSHLKCSEMLIHSDRGIPIWS